jgi:O-methyltransferase
MLRSIARSVLKVMPNPVRELAYDLRYAGLPDPFRIVRPHSMLTHLNLFFLQELARRVDQDGVRGDFVECGVYRGGSAGVLGHAAMRSPFARKLWLYDSFAGMPEATDRDDDHSHAIAGQFIGSEAQTRRILQRVGVPDDRVAIIVGRFEETLPKAERPPIAILHVDCDFYEPVVLTLETFYDHVEPLGCVVFNDYGSFQGCRRATDEFLTRRGLTSSLTQIDQDAYFFRKPAAAQS